MPATRQAARRPLQRPARPADTPWMAWLSDLRVLIPPFGTGVLASVAVAALSGLALWLYFRQHHKGRQLEAKLKWAKSELETLRSKDALTGLALRPELEAKLDRAVNTCDIQGRSVSVLYVSLDNFREINEGYGMRVGDAVLVQLSKRLLSCSEPKTPVARISGDEFALLVPGGADLATDTASRLLEATQQALKIGGHELRLTASIGVAVYPGHGARTKLLSHAALAMRTAKLGGGAGYATFDPSMSVDVREQAELLRDLRKAVDSKELQLCYQPKVDARSLQITGAEALVRWKHPQRGIVSPGLFIPLAERHGLIRSIGSWVIEEACRQTAEWRQRGLRMRVAVNISGHQMRQEDLVGQIQASMQRHRIRPERLTLEITETVAMEDTRQTRATFERLRRAGLHVSIDDFGTGYSSLGSLRSLPAAELKIDRTFVTDLHSSTEARSIVKAVVDMAHTLKLRVVAEGVETAEQRDLLVAMGCDELQGFLFSKPMTPGSLAMWAQQDARAERNGLFRASLFDDTAPAPMNT
jgi:diguanylate cyclase (GGDEF)-like protein